jgi:hypothetical protein
MFNITKQPLKEWYKDTGGKKNKLELYFTYNNNENNIDKFVLKIYSGREGKKFTECKDQEIYEGKLEKKKEYIFRFRINVPSKCHNNELFKIKIELDKNYILSNSIRVFSKDKKRKSNSLDLSSNIKRIKFKDNRLDKVFDFVIDEKIKLEEIVNELEEQVKELKEKVKKLEYDNKKNEKSKAKLRDDLDCFFSDIGEESICYNFPWRD